MAPSTMPPLTQLAHSGVWWHRMLTDADPATLGHPIDGPVGPTVADVVWHVVAGNHLLVGRVRRRDDPRPAQPDQPAPAELAQRYRHSMGELLMALRECAALAHPVELHGTVYDGDAAVVWAVAEQLVHGWEVAAALGAGIRPEPTAVAAAAGEVIGLAPARGADPCAGPALAVGEDADPLMAIVAAHGRSPLGWSPEGLPVATPADQGPPAGRGPGLSRRS